MESKNIEKGFQTVKKKNKSTRKNGCENQKIYKFPCCDSCGRRSGVMGQNGYKEYLIYKNACKFNYRNERGNLITADVGNPHNTRFLRSRGCRSIPGASLNESQQIKLAKVLGRCAAKRERFTAKCIHDNCEYEEKNPGAHVNRIQDLREVETICENNRRMSRRGSISRKGWGHRRRKRSRKGRKKRRKRTRRARR